MLRMTLLIGALAYAGPANATTLLPFEVKVAATAHVSPTPDACLFSNNEAGSITSKALGDGTWSDVEAVNFCSVAGGAGVSAQFVLSIGSDKLFGIAETTGAFEADGQLHIKGTFTIIGGTGKYAGAKGAGVITGAAAPPDATGSGPLSATLVGLATVPEASH